MKYFILIFTFVFLSHLSEANTLDHGKYLFPTNKNLQWAVSFLGKPLDKKLEKKIKKYANYQKTSSYCSGLSKLDYENLKVWSVRNCSGPDMAFYFKDNKLVKVEAVASYVDATYIYKNDDYFSFIDKGAYTPANLDAVIQAKELPFTVEERDVSDTHTMRFYFVSYEPAELLIEIHNYTIESHVDYKLIPRTTVISVSTDDIDNSYRQHFLSYDKTYASLEFPKNYKTFSNYIKSRDKIADLEKRIASLPVLKAQNNILDLRNGVCIQGCENGDKTSVIHYGNYLYKGKLKNGVPHDEDGTAILYKLNDLNINQIKKFIAYESSEIINCVIINGGAFLNFIDFDISKGIAITKPYKHPLLKKNVYAQVQIMEDGNIDTNFAFLYTTKACTEQSKVYGGAINQNFEANGIGDFKWTEENKEYIIRTHWQNNRPHRKKINNEGVNGNKEITYVITDYGKLVTTNIVDLEIDPIGKKLLLSALDLTKTQYEESILINPKAKPIQRLIGGFAFHEKMPVLFGKHYVQNYKGTGDVNDTNNWETVKSCQLSSLESKTSCFISGDNFYELKECYNN